MAEEHRQKKVEAGTRRRRRKLKKEEKQERRLRDAEVVFGRLLIVDLERTGDCCSR